MTYSQITLNPGDEVSIEAGGCVQTGGLGKTWKSYVYPKGPDSDKYYYGTVSFSSIPGSARLSDILSQTISIPRDLGQPTYLELGYVDSDDDYGDNGYWGHDNGTGDQCKDVGPAWVIVTIRHGGSSNMEYNIYRPGGDWMRIRPPAASLDRCIAECRDRARCVAFSYQQGKKCYLKESVPRAQFRAGFTSSVK